MKLNGWNQYYPRPQLRRNSYFPLNQGWTLNGRPIQVPWPPQAPLSLWEGAVGDVLQYKTSFTLPADFLSENRRALLNFGAVDQVAEVFVNGERVIRHEGGYLPFTADITDALRPGENLLEVTAVDSLSHDYPSTGDPMGCGTPLCPASGRRYGLRRFRPRVGCGLYASLRI